MKALILAGGFGTRLRRVIYDRPKSMAPIVGIPFLEHQIRLLKQQGIIDFILCVSYMADKIKSYFGEGKKVGVNITYSEEEIPLGTAGAIKKAERYINSTFLALNGDAYFRIDIAQFLDFHKSKNSEFSVALGKVKVSSTHGYSLLKNDKIVDFTSKKEESEGLGNNGVYIIEPSIFNYIEPDKNISLEKDILPKLAKEGRLYGYPFKGYYTDIGLPETYHKFKTDVIISLCIQEKDVVRDALKKIDKTGINFVLVTKENGQLCGTLTQREITQFILKGGDLNESIFKAMNKKPLAVKANTKREEINKFFQSGTEFVPIIDDFGIIKDIEFPEEEIERKTFPIIKGRAPLRISFAGGGTDLNYFFEKYGGAVINATINKYCYGTLIKRADKKIIINSDLEQDIIVDSIFDLKYDGKLDLTKAAIKIIKPEFGFELYIHSDLPPGRGLGSSASLAVLIISLFNHLMDTKHNDYIIAELAYRVEREELKIKGGWQDQYATVTGGFNFMEFSAEKSLVYPLRLKKEVLEELQNHLLLCYVGKTRDSGEIHKSQEKSFYQNEKEKINKLNRLKELTYDIREALLTNHLETFGRLLNETWIIKKSLDAGISNNIVDTLYDIGLKNGAYGGRLLGAGAGGYILFFYSPKRRNDLKRAIELAGGEVTNIGFDLEGVQVWNSKHRF